MRRNKISATIVIGMVAFAVPAAAAPVPWTTQTTANPSHKQNDFNAVSASSGSAWAVGSDVINGRSHPLLEHLTKAGWVKYSVKLRSGDNDLQGVAALSKSNVWAVGSHITDHGGGVMIQHFNGKSWSNVSAPYTALPKNGQTVHVLTGIVAVSSSNIWAGGYTSCQAFQCSQRPLTEHFNGKSWSVVKAPNPAGDTTIYTVGAYNSGHVWAAGTNNGNGKAEMLGYNGKSWHAVTIPEPGHTNEIYGLTGKNAKAIWAVGSYEGASGPAKTLTLHRVDGVWHKVASPSPKANGSRLNAVTAISANNVWAVGEYADPSETSHPLIEHYNGTSWSIVTVPDSGSGDRLFGVTVRSSGQAFAVGSTSTSDNADKTLALTKAG